MPTSNLAVAPTVLAYAWEARPTDRPYRVVDVGPGHGKYAVLVREYIDPLAELVAIEAWAPYVADFRLDCLYDHVVVADVRSLDTRVTNWLRWADTVLILDVLEHIPKTEALAVLDRIPGHVVFSTPRDFFDNGPGLAPTEEHVSHWTPDDFAATGRLHGIDERTLTELGGIVGRLNPQ